MYKRDHTPPTSAPLGASTSRYMFLSQLKSSRKTLWHILLQAYTRSTIVFFALPMYYYPEINIHWLAPLCQEYLEIP